MPALESWVRARSAHYDRRFLSHDPEFLHAHITVLAPLTVWDEDALAHLAAATEPFSFRLETLDLFPNGVVYLAPTPDLHFRHLTQQAWELMPDVVPFGVPSPQPHLTLDAVGPDVTVASTRNAIAPLLPAVGQATSLELVWYEADNCRLLRRWSLGAS